MPSRKISDLCEEMQAKAIAFAALMAQSGIPFVFTCTYRSQSEQDELYARGRTKPGKKVTWTKRSKHTERKAFDICIVDKQGKALWDLKVDVNDDEVSDYVQAGELGERIGLVWGGRFRNPDYVHFELKEGK